MEYYFLGKLKRYKIMYTNIANISLQKYWVNLSFKLIKMKYQ